MPRGPRRKGTQSEEDISADKARSFDEWMKEKADDIRGRCSAYGLGTKGTKRQMVLRLRQHLTADEDVSVTDVSNNMISSKTQATDDQVLKIAALSSMVEALKQQQQ